jgi:hypothetical protein
MWPWRPTQASINEDCPRLSRKVLVKAGALSPGKITLWGWNTPAGALAIRVTGALDGFTIAGSGIEVRVILRASCMICPSCGASVRYLLWRSEWGCRFCRGVDYRYRHQFTEFPILRWRRLQERLAREPVLSSRSVELRRLLARVERQITRKIGNEHRAYRRACSPRTARRRRARRRDHSAVHGCRS